MSDSTRACAQMSDALRNERAVLLEMAQRVAGTMQDGATSFREARERIYELEHEVKRLTAEVQTAFDKGYRAAGGTITPILRQPAK